MLKNGAPVRHIQEMLGHESLKSTQVYTRVTINDLKKIHAQYHPSEQTTA
jgi:integrase/recombinase XerD